MKKLLLSLALALTAAGLLAACGGGGPSAPAVEPNGNTVDLAIEAKDFEFNQPEYRVKAGDTVNVTFANAQGMHGIDIVGYDVNLGDGESATFVAAPGEYDIVCNIMCGTGHSQMRAKLIVEE